MTAPAPDQHLIILRGNSGSGKTTLARRLQLAMGRGTANIGQDHLRRIILRDHAAAGAPNVDFIGHTARYCLGIGYHVILEGILHTEVYGQMLRELIRAHRGPAHVVYLDIPFEETLRRHETRASRSDFGATEMREWYLPRDLLGVPGEMVLRAELTEDEALARLLDEVGPVSPRE